VAPLDDPVPGQMAVAKSRQTERVKVVKLIARAWENAGVAVECELCGERDWSLVATDDADGVALPLRDSGEVNLQKNFLVYAVDCRTCGNVRLMSKIRVEEVASGEYSE